MIRKTAGKGENIGECSCYCSNFEKIDADEMEKCTINRDYEHGFVREKRVERFAIN